MSWRLLTTATLVLLLGPLSSLALPQTPEEELKKKEATPANISVKKLEDIEGTIGGANVKGDSAWVMVATALVMLMVPGLALFYGGMVRRKNILATMMHSMVALAVVGVFWVGIGYSLAFGDPWIASTKEVDGKAKVFSYVGYSPEFVFMKDVKVDAMVPGLNIPIYLHMLFQGMFAIITPALISGALAERIRFRTYVLFILLWVGLIYCPLAHMVWALDWKWTATLAGNPPAASDVIAVGWLGALGALDFAGGTVVHIAAGFSSLAAILVLRKRMGYPQLAIHPSSMVLCLTGAGILWFGWFGFNGGSSGGSGPGAVSAFAATQAAAAAAALSWMLVEWIHRGKPTALGLASGLVAGLVAVTPASGYIYIWGGLIIGLLAGVVCYISVAVVKPMLGYDDSLDAFGVHGVGGFLGAVLTGAFCYKEVNSAGAAGWMAVTNGFNPDNIGAFTQLYNQTYAAIVSAVLALVGSLVLVKVLDLLLGFTTSEGDEVLGLDQTEHGESGFDYGLAMETAALGMTSEPRAAKVPPGTEKRYSIVVSGVQNGELMHAWSELCQPAAAPPTEFKQIYPHMTTVRGNRFTFRSGDPETVRASVQKLFRARVNNPAITASVE